MRIADNRTNRDKLSQDAGLWKGPTLALNSAPPQPLHEGLVYNQGKLNVCRKGVFPAAGFAHSVYPTSKWGLIDESGIKNENQLSGMGSRAGRGNTCPCWRARSSMEPLVLEGLHCKGGSGKERGAKRWCRVLGIQRPARAPREAPLEKMQEISMS